MAQDIKVKLRLDDSEFQNLGNDKRQVDDFGKSVNGAAQQISDQIKQQVRAAESIGNYKRQLRDTIRSIQNLSGAYAQLSDADKNGAVGQAMSQRLSELKQKAGALKDAVSDINTEVKNLASDTLNYDAFKQSVTAGRDIMSAYVSVMQLAGGESESLEMMMKKLAQIYTISNSLISVGNILQKQSAVMVKLRTGQEALLATATKLRAAAESKGVIATKAATIAQAALNAVCKANPYVLLASAIVAGIAALTIFTKKSKEAADAEKAQQAALEKARKEQEHYADVVSSTAGKIIGKYKQLQNEYKNLSSATEKRLFIKNHSNELKEFSDGINTINAADRLFIKQSEAVEKALMARARATAMAQIYQEKLTQHIKDEINNPFKAGKQQLTASKGFEVSSADPRAIKAGIDAKTDYEFEMKQNPYTGALEAQPTNRLNESGLKKWNEMRKKEADERKRIFDKELDDYESFAKKYDEIARKMEAKAGLKRNSNTNNTDDKKSKPLPGSLKDLQEQQSKFEENLASGKLVLDTSEALKKREEFEKKIHDKKVSLGLEADDNSIAGLEKQINQLKEKIKNNQLTISTEEAEQTLEALQDRLTKLQIDAEVNPTPESIAALEKQLSNIQNRYKNGWLDISPEEYKKVTTELQNAIDQKSYEMNIKVNPNIEKVKQLDEQYSEAIKPEQKSSFEQAMDKVYPNPMEDMSKQQQNDYQLDAIEKQMNLNDKLLESLNKIAKAYQKLGEAGAEGFAKVQGKISEVIQENDDLSKQAVDIEKDNKKIKKQEKNWNAVSDSISGVGSALQSLSSVGDDPGTKAASIIAEAIAQIMLGFAAASAKEGQSGNIWTWIAASVSGLAVALSTVAQIKSAGAFASGGIVRGGSMADGLTAQVSSGEMILNNYQQQHLWRIINGHEQYSNNLNGRVQFELRGDALYGVLRNYGKQMQKVNKDIGIH